MFAMVSQNLQCAQHTHSFIYENMKMILWSGKQQNRIKKHFKGILCRCYAYNFVVLFVCFFFFGFRENVNTIPCGIYMDNFLHSALRVNNQMPFRNKMIQAWKLK